MTHLLQAAVTYVRELSGIQGMPLESALMHAQLRFGVSADAILANLSGPASSLDELDPTR